MDEGRATDDGCARSQAPRLLQLATVVVSNPSFTTLAVDASSPSWGATGDAWHRPSSGGRRTRSLTWSAVPGWNLGRRPWYLTPLSQARS